VTLDELEQVVRRVHERGAGTEATIVTGVLRQVIEFLGTAPFRHLNNVGMADRTLRDEMVAQAICAHLAQVVLYAASAPIRPTCPYGHEVTDEPGGCLPGSCAFR
jgi:hypothetical protein